MNQSNQSNRLGNFLAVAYLVYLVYAIFFSPAPAGLSYVATIIFMLSYNLSANLIANTSFGFAIFRLALLAVFGFSIYFPWTILTWIWPLKLLFGIMVGYGTAGFLVAMGGFNSSLDLPHSPE